jgi:uncharacterized membrane protein YdjX (TVP38/TMEM64 family)
MPHDAPHGQTGVSLTGVSTHPADPAPTRAFSLLKLWPLGLVVAASLLLLVSGWYADMSLATLARYHGELDRAVADHFILSALGFILAYIVCVILSIPGATVLKLSGGLLFGALIGGVLTMVGATVGAMVIFTIAKTSLGEEILTRAGPRLTRFVDGFKSDAFTYLVFLRLMPVIPFAVVNIGAALVGIPASTFIGATALGIIPATFLYAFVGAGFDSVIAGQRQVYDACVAAGSADCTLSFDPTAAVTPGLLAALAALGVAALLPVMVKTFKARKARMRTVKACMAKTSMTKTSMTKASMARRV